jgi:glycosyltransferase involved in cell wall biosynthesis
VLFLGRIHPIKRLDLVADAFVRLREAVPHAHLVIAGPDERGHRRSIEPLLREAGDSVHWVGPVEDREKWAWLSASRVLVQCSDSESFGMSIAEALCAGVPVVTTERGPWQELGAAGCALVVPHTSEAIAAALQKVLEFPREADEMSARGRAWAARRFGWDDIAQQMVHAYDSALVSAPTAA